MRTGGAVSFKLSSFDLYPHRNITYNLGNKVMDYSFIREWNAYAGKDEVHVLLQVKNPFWGGSPGPRAYVTSQNIYVEIGFGGFDGAALCGTSLDASSSENLASAMARIASHPDLINADCRALARLVRDDIAEYKDPGHAVIRGDAPGWDEVVAAIWPVADHAPVT